MRGTNKSKETKRLLGIELIRDGEDDVAGEDTSIHLKFDASVSAPGCLQFRGLRMQALLKRHVSSLEEAGKSVTKERAFFPCLRGSKIMP